MANEQQYYMEELSVACTCTCCDVPDGGEFDVLDVICDCNCPIHGNGGSGNQPGGSTPDVPRYTTFEEMYSFFLAGITDDMFMELTEEDTKAILEEILMGALPWFEFPRKDIFDVDLEFKRFNCWLTLEEKFIIRHYMIVEWIGYQLASIENIRQKYSGSDFKFTSQASHIDKLLKLKQDYQDKGFKAQRIYCRRKKANDGNYYASSFAKIMEKPSW